MLFNRFLKKWLPALLLLCILVCSTLSSKAQYFDLQPNVKHVNIPFHIVRNMIVITLKINGKGPFNFILDTGVGLMVITEPKLVDSINLTSKRVIKIPGLGNGDDDEAYITSVLKIEIPGLESHDVNAAILNKDHFNLSNFAGMPISGLLGYEFFSNIAIRVNFSDSTLNICRPADLKPFRRGIKVPITIEQRKSYMLANITFPNGKTVNDKLVIDLGAGHPISIENMVKNSGMPKKFIPANLGVGLNGPIDGFLSRVSAVEIGKYRIKDVIASFPDDNKPQPELAVPRDGNLGIGILKRFDVIFDYPDNIMYLRPGELFNEPFEHDMSGMEYFATGDYKHVIIDRVESGSPADNIGLERGDEITAVNFVPVSKMTLEEIDAIFRSRDDRGILLEIYHDKKYDKVILTLKRRI